MKNSVKRIIQRVKQFRLIGYVVIGVSIWKTEGDINSLILKMFLLILFTELSSRGKSKSQLEQLREDLFIDEKDIIDYGDRKELEKEDIDKLH